MRGGGIGAAREVIRWNSRWLSCETAVAIILAFGTYIGGRSVIYSALGWLLQYMAFSRVNEIVYAFYGDASARISRAKPRTPLRASQRIKLAMRSYLSLTLNFAAIAFFLPSRYYHPCFEKFHDALYFSGVTIATLGYGDITPLRMASKFLSVYEVFAGVLLVVVALGVYISRLEAKNDA